MGRFREGGKVVFPRAVAEEFCFIHGEVCEKEFDGCDWGDICVPWGSIQARARAEGGEGLLDLVQIG